MPVKDTARDHEAIGTANSYGVLNLRQWAKVLKNGYSTGAKRFRLLESAGWVRRLELPNSSLLLLAPTQSGCDLIGDSLPPITSVKLAEHRHDSMLFDLSQAIVAKRGGIWIPERRLRQRGHAGHIPDGLLRLGGSNIAIELELSAKAPQRLSEILAQHASNLNHHETWYFTDNDEVARLVGRLAVGYSMIKVIRFTRKNSHAR